MVQHYTVKILQHLNVSFILIIKKYRFALNAHVYNTVTHFNKLPNIFQHTHHSADNF